MSGGKKKKSSASASKAPKKEKVSGGSKEKENNVMSSNTPEDIKVETPVTVTTLTSATTAYSTTASSSASAVDVLDRLAPPILFFPPNVSEEYLNRFYPEVSATTSTASGLLADEGFPDREIPVMRRLLAMMAGIMSKASAASARAYYSRVAGTEGRRNGYFQQNLNTSVFNLFSTLSAAGNESSGGAVPSSKDLHLTPPAAFTAKDGESLRGYPQRLMKFWRQLSPAEQLRLVKEEHAALTNSWIESRKAWCLCAHCKHRRMTISDLTDCLYQTYCEELEAFITSGGQGSTLYSANLTNSMEPAARARRFLFKSLSVVGEQALLPRYNQFILRLEAFSSMAFSLGNGAEKGQGKGSSKGSIHSNAALPNPLNMPNLKASSLKSAALQASKEFLQKHGRNPTATDLDEEMTISIKDIDPEFDPKNPMKGLSFKIIQDSDEELEEFVREVRVRRNYSDDDERLISDNESEVDEEYEDGRSHQGGIQSEDDDDLIDDETDLPIDESELMLPGGASFPLLPAGDGPVQWSESSRIECGRTVFLMFASEMFQYRLTAAYLAHQTRLRQLKLIAEVEEEERLEKEKRAKEEKEKKERAEMEKKKKAAKKEKAAAKANGSKSKKNEKVKVVKETVKEMVKDPVVSVELEIEIEIETEVIEEPIAPETPATSQPVFSTSIEPVTLESNTSAPTTSTAPSIFDFTTPIIPLTNPHDHDQDEDDDFDPTELVEQLAKEMNRFEMSNINSATSGPVSPMGPPGFAPPPGFSSATPKHLIEEQVTPPQPLFHYPRPPFAFEQVQVRSQSQEEMFYSRPPPQAQVYQHPVHSTSTAQYPPVHPSYFGYPQYHVNNMNNMNHVNPMSYENHSYPSHAAHAPHLAHPVYHPVYNHPPPPPPSASASQYPAYQQPKQAHLPPSHPQATFNPFDDDHQQQQQQQSQSRFQSFFSKSIFGPSSFFSQ